MPMAMAFHSFSERTVQNKLNAKNLKRAKFRLLLATVILVYLYLTSIVICQLLSLPIKPH